MNGQTAVTRQENADMREQHRGVPRCMTIVNDHLRGRVVPGDAVRAGGQRHQAAAAEPVQRWPQRGS